MSLLKKLTKIAKTSVKAYATYQTGGLSGLATSALSKAGKKKKALLPMVSPMGMNASPLFGLKTTQAALRVPSMQSMRQGLSTAADLVGIGSGLSLMSGAGAMPIEGITTVASRKRRKYRRMNPGNIKALRRSVRRIHSAEKMFRQVLSVQGKHHGGIKPKKGRGKR